MHTFLINLMFPGFFFFFPSHRHSRSQSNYAVLSRRVAGTASTLMLNLRSTFCYQSRHCLQTHPFIFCNTVKCIQTPCGPRAPWSSTFAKFVQIMLHHYFVKVKEKKNAPNQRQNVNYTMLFFSPQFLSGKY